MMRDEDRIVHPLLKGRITVYVNAGLCIVGAVFIVVGVVRSTLLLYVGCAVSGTSSLSETCLDSSLVLTDCIPVDGFRLFLADPTVLSVNVNDRPNFYIFQCRMRYG